MRPEWRLHSCVSRSTNPTVVWRTGQGGKGWSPYGTATPDNEEPAKRRGVVDRWDMKAPIEPVPVMRPSTEGVDGVTAWCDPSDSNSDADWHWRPSCIFRSCAVAHKATAAAMQEDIGVSLGLTHGRR